MADPLGFLVTADAAALLAIVLGAALAVQQLFTPLKTDEARRGILSLQLAWTTPRALRIVTSWTKRRLLGAAKRSTYLDFAYIPLYVCALSLLATLAGRAADSSGVMSASNADTAAAASTIAALAAGLLDFIENGGLLLSLSGHTGQPAPAATSCASTGKWLLGFGVVLSSVGLLLASAYLVLKDAVA